MSLSIKVSNLNSDIAFESPFEKKLCENVDSEADNSCVDGSNNFDTWCGHCIISRLYDDMSTKQYEKFHCQVQLEADPGNKILTQGQLYGKMKEHLQAMEDEHACKTECLLCFRDGPVL